jgi:hypothetical protein
LEKGGIDEYKEGYTYRWLERERHMGRKMEKQTYRRIKIRNK